jgi:hypothetical protein
MKKLTVMMTVLTIGGAALAQTPVEQPSTSTKIENWTTEEWNATKAEWAKDKAKWTDCEQKSTDQKLTGTKSWSFLYTCMTSAETRPPATAQSEGAKLTK